MPAIATRTLLAGLLGDRSCGCSFRVGRRAVRRALARSARRSTRDRVGWTGPGARGATGCSDRWCGSRGLRSRGQPLGELGAAALEEREAGGGVEVAAERELHREGALVVGALVGEELGEQRPAAVGDAVGLAGPPAGRARRRMRAAARSPLSEPVGTKCPPRPGSAALVDLFDRAGPLEAAERRVQRAERDAPQRARASRTGASSARSRGAAARRATRERRAPTCVPRYIESIYRASTSSIMQELSSSCMSPSGAMPVPTHDTARTVQMSAWTTHLLSPRCAGLNRCPCWPAVPYCELRRGTLAARGVRAQPQVHAAAQCIGSDLGDGARLWHDEPAAGVVRVRRQAEAGQRPRDRRRGGASETRRVGGGYSR